MSRFVILVLLALVTPDSLQATEFYSWHGFEFPLRLAEKVEVVLHHRTRTRHEWSYLDQSRAGAIVRWTAARGIVPYAGYYYQPQQLRADEWVRGQRVFLGAEKPFHLNSTAALTTRLAMERFFGTGRLDYNRYRSYCRLLLGGGRLTPFFQNEMLAVRQGYHSMRNSGGLRIRLSSFVHLEASYLYDVRRTVWGGDRQALVTGIRIESR